MNTITKIKRRLTIDMTIEEAKDFICKTKIIGLDVLGKHAEGCLKYPEALLNLTIMYQWGLLDKITEGKERVLSTDGVLRMSRDKAIKAMKTSILEDLKTKKNARQFVDDCSRLGIDVLSKQMILLSMEDVVTMNQLIFASKMGTLSKLSDLITKIKDDDEHKG